MSEKIKNNPFDFSGDLLPSNSSRRAHVSGELERVIRENLVLVD